MRLSNPVRFSMGARLANDSMPLLRGELLHEELPASPRVEASSLTPDHPDAWPDPNAIAGERPRVVMIGNLLPPYRIPWLQAVVRSGAIRFEVWLMTPGEQNRDWKVPWESRIPIEVFPDWGFDFSRRGYITLHFNPSMLARLSREPPDVVILAGYDSLTCLAAALLLHGNGVPFLFGTEGVDLRETLTGRWLPWLVRRCFAICNGVFVPGRASMNHARDLGVAPDRIFLSPNSVDPDRFRPPRSPGERRDLRQSFALPEGLLCLYVGQLTRMKGTDLLLDAFSYATSGRSDVHLLLVGAGDLEPSLRQRVRSDPNLEGHVHFLGARSQEDLSSLYRASDIFLFPTRFDVWGMVLNEAMSSGLPVISSDSAGGAVDLVEDGVTGFRFPSGDVTALAAKLTLLLDDGAMRDRMGREARTKIMNGFTPDRQAQEMLKAVSFALSDKRARR